MAISTLTSKGQITIPQKVRKQLCLRTGDKLDFQVDDNGLIVLSPANKGVSEVFGLLQHRAKRKVSVKDMDRELKQAFRGGKL